MTHATEQGGGCGATGPPSKVPSSHPCPVCGAGLTARDMVSAGGTGAALPAGGYKFAPAPWPGPMAITVTAPTYRVTRPNCLPPSPSPSLTVPSNPALSACPWIVQKLRVPVCWDHTYEEGVLLDGQLQRHCQQVGSQAYTPPSCVGGHAAWHGTSTQHHIPVCTAAV